MQGIIPVTGSLQKYQYQQLPLPEPRPAPGEEARGAEISAKPAEPECGK